MIRLYVDITETPLTVQVGDVLEVKAVWSSGAIIDLEPVPSVQDEPPPLGVNVTDVLDLRDRIGG